MKLIFISICMLVVATSHAQAEALYRWVDKDGKVHYGDRPAEGAIRAEQKKFVAPTVGDDDLPYSVRKTKQDFPVTLYVAPNCGDICVQAHSFLNKRGIPFVEKNLASKEEVDAFKAKTGGNNVPALTLGKKFLSGFEPGLWNGELDIAGYPKTAPLGSRPVLPAAAQPEAPATSDVPAPSEQ